MGLQLVGIGKGVRVNTSLNPIVRKNIQALSKQMDVPQTVVINSLCAYAFNQLTAPTKVTTAKKATRRATTTTKAKRKR